MHEVHWILIPILRLMTSEITGFAFLSLRCTRILREFGTPAGKWCHGGVRLYAV